MKVNVNISMTCYVCISHRIMYIIRHVMLDVFFYVCDLVISYRNEVGNKVTSYSTSVSAGVFIYLCDNNHKRRYNIILVHVYNLYKSFLFTLVWSFFVGRKLKHPMKTYPSNVVTTCPSHMSGILT